MKRIKGMLALCMAGASLLLEGPATHAAEIPNRGANSGYALCSSIYATKNIEPDKVIDLMQDLMITTDGEFKPYPNASFTYEFKSNGYLYFYFTHDGNTFTQMTKVQTIESSDSAEYCILKNNYDNYLIAVDGSTTKTDPGVYLNHFIESEVDYQTYPSFLLPTSIASDYDLQLVEGNKFTYIDGKEYIAYGMARIGYHLCNGNEIQYEDPVKDKDSYGGTEDNDITIPEDSKSNEETKKEEKKTPSKLAVITASSLGGILIIILIYEISNKLKHILRKDN